jgi:hypothetical protein
MLAVLPEYAMLPDSVGAAYCVNKVCWADAELSRPLALPSATTMMFAFSVSAIEMDAVVPLTEVVTPVVMTLLSDAFRTCTSLTPDATAYVMLAVLPEYVMLPDNVGAAYCVNKVCVADAELSRPLALPTATTKMLTVSVSANEMDALVPLTEVVTPVVMTLPSDAFRTCTAVTPDATAYVMLAVLPEYAMLPDSVGAAYCANKVCWADAALSRPLALPSATTMMFAFSVSAIEMDALVPLTEVVTPVAMTSPLAFRTCTAVTPDATAYVMLAVLPEYAMLPDSVGAANCAIKVCWADAALS